LLATGTAHAEVAPTDDIQAKIDAIVEKYRPQVEAAERTINDEADHRSPIQLKGKCSWDLTSAKFDVPQVTFELRHFSFHTLKTTMKLREFSFDRPVVRWGMTHIGPVKLHLPKIYNERVRWSTKIPEFRWELTEWSTKIPEFRMETTEIKFHTLKCKLTDAYVGPPKPSNDSMKTINREEEHLRELMATQTAEINAAVQDDLAAVDASFRQEMAVAEAQIDEAVASLDASIAELVAHGQSAAAIQVDFEGQQIPLTEVRERMLKKKAELRSAAEAEWQTAKAGMG
jgi:hypothetical protein